MLVAFNITPVFRASKDRGVFIRADLGCITAINYVVPLLTFCYCKVYGRVAFILLQACETKATVAGFLPSL
jgi:hypothetical protein